MTVTLEGSSGPPGEAFGTPSGTRLVAGLAARRGWAQRGAARRAPFPAGCAERAWQLERLRLQEASLGPDTLGEGRGRERAKSQAPQPRRPAARPETGAVPGEGSSGRWAPGGGQRGIRAVLPVPATSLLAPNPGGVGRGVL